MMLGTDERIHAQLPPRFAGHPAAAGGGGQPHRCRRGDRAPGCGGEGAGRERARRWRPAYPGCNRGWRHCAHRGRRRRRRHERRGTGARGAAPRHLQAGRRRSRPHRHARLSRRGAAGDRRGRPARHHHASGGRSARPYHSRGRRPGRRAGAVGRTGRHPRRGARPVLRHPGAAQVPEAPAHRGRARRGGDPPAGVRRAGGGVPVRKRRADGVRPAGAGPERAGGRTARRGSRRRPAAGGGRARGRAPVGLRLLARRSPAPPPRSRRSRSMAGPSPIRCSRLRCGSPIAR